MKRVLLISGCLFLLVGVFYDSLPLELSAGLWRIFTGNSHTYYRVVPSEQISYVQVLLLVFGAVLVVGALLRPRSSLP